MIPAFMQHAGLSASVQAMFAADEQDVWYDPSDIERYMGNLGPELVTNGAFDAGVDGWTLGAVTPTTVDGSLYTSLGLSGWIAWQVITTVAGKTYKATGNLTGAVTAYVINGTQVGGFQIIPGTGSDLYFNRCFVAMSSSTLIGFYSTSVSPGKRTVDNISIREVTQISTATLFQDSAGTTPVTGYEQPVGLMLDKSKGLVLGSPLALSYAYLVPLSGTATSNGNGTYTVSNGGYVRFFYNLADLKQGAYYKVEVEVLSGTGKYVLQWCDIGWGLSGTGIRSVIAGRNYDNTYRFVDFEGADTNPVTFRLLSVRELPGNHCVFKSGSGRPVLSAVVNLLTYTEDFSNAVWVKGNASVDSVKVTAPNGTLTAQKLVENTANGTHQLYAVQAMPTAPNTFSIYVKAAGRSKIYFGGNWALINALIDLETGEVSGSGASRITVTPETNGWWRIVSTDTPPDTVARSYVVRLNNGASDTYTGDGVSGVYIWGADLRMTNSGANLPAYQRVTTAANCDIAGFPIYLRADGADDGGSTNSIDLTGTDKVTIFAGIRKMSDTGDSRLLEFSETISNNGSFNVSAPPNANLGRYGSATKGTTSAALQASATPYNYPAPISSVLSISIDNAQGAVAGNAIKIRHNGTTMPCASDGFNSTTPANYGNYRLFLFSRNNASHYFNGRLYSLIVLGRAATATEIASTERYINQKTKAY